MDILAFLILVLLLLAMGRLVLAALAIQKNTLLKGCFEDHGFGKGHAGAVPLAFRCGNLPQGRRGVASWQPAARVATQCPPHR